MDKIKDRVVKKRQRLLEFFKDYDKLFSGRVSENNFKRGMDLSGLGLAEMEVEILMRHYKAADGNIRYNEFYKDIESAFTVYKLEKTPTVNVNLSSFLSPHSLSLSLSTLFVTGYTVKFHRLHSKISQVTQ